MLKTKILPAADNAYPPGATIATFSLQCAGLSGQISAVALARIPMDVVRTSTTNGTNVLVGRQGQHSISPKNAEYRLFATVASWVLLPAFAAGMAWLSFDITKLIWVLAALATASVLFETPREWILDRFQ